MLVHRQFTGDCAPDVSRSQVGIGVVPVAAVGIDDDKARSDLLTVAMDLLRAQKYPTPRIVVHLEF
jgi:hypothetical protein